MANPKSLVLTVSSATFSEIAMEMSKKGIKLGEGNIDALSEITLEKGTTIEQPHEWALIRLRKDCAEIVTKLFEFYPDETSIPHAIEELFQYVLSGTLPDADAEAEETKLTKFLVLAQTKKDEWK